MRLEILVALEDAIYLDFNHAEAKCVGQQTGNRRTVDSVNWYQCGADLGARRAAMMFDADNNGYHTNAEGASTESGNLAFYPPPLPEGRTEYKSNLWVWSFGMNESSKKKDAAWLFIQYFTGPEHQLWSSTEWKSVDPPRASVFNHPDFQEKIAKVHGFKEAFDKTIDGVSIYFTPHPFFFELTDLWAETLQGLVMGQYASTQEGMDKLKARMDSVLRDIDVD